LLRVSKLTVLSQVELEAVGMRKDLEHRVLVAKGQQVSELRKLVSERQAAAARYHDLPPVSASLTARVLRPLQDIALARRKVEEIKAKVARIDADIARSVQQLVL
jgi:hypothetical protein